MGLLCASVAHDTNAFVQSSALRLCCTQLLCDVDSDVTVPVLSVGSEAAQILQREATGRVLAVFNRCFYVQCDQSVLCVGLPCLGRGPLHVVLASTQNRLPPLIVDALVINLGCQDHRNAASDRGGCCTKRKCSTPYSGSVCGSAFGARPQQQAQMQQLLSMLVPVQVQGFGWMVGNCDGYCQKSVAQDASWTTSDKLAQGLRQLCLPALQSLSRWLQHSLQVNGEPCNVTLTNDSNSRSLDTRYEGTAGSVLPAELSSQVPTLLGAGPGLTPAGDDLLAGVMLALHHIKRVELANALWTLLEPEVGMRTNIISGAHLRLAAQGQCSESMLQLLSLLFSETTASTGYDVQRKAADIRAQANSMGASSGWDTLAGITLVLRAQ